MNYAQALEAIKAGRAQAHALWVLIGTEQERDGFALKPATWEGPGEYQRVSTVDDDFGALVYLPVGKRLPLPSDVKAPPRPRIRLATDDERAAILAAYKAVARIDDDELADCAIYIRENFMCDSPGYIGPVAIIHWCGDPHFVDTLTFYAGAWRVSEEAAMDALRSDPATPERAADAGESIEEFVCGTVRGHQFPRDIGERDRCLCLWCGKDGDA